MYVSEKNIPVISFQLDESLRLSICACVTRTQVMACSQEIPYASTSHYSPTSKETHLSQYLTADFSWFYPNRNVKNYFSQKITFYSKMIVSFLYLGL